MRYYIVAGEASGDLHASNLISAIIGRDKEAVFRFIGGDNMIAASGERGSLSSHYKKAAYMGFIPVALHLPTILRLISMCRKDILSWKPDVLLLVDYPGFNLRIAKYIKSKSRIPIFYYISPKIWAWKEYRIKSIKRDVDLMLSILPFEEDYYAEKHGYKVYYVGNPTADEVNGFRKKNPEGCRDLLGSKKPVIALLAGSRLQEISLNLPSMIKASAPFSGEYDIVIAGAPSVSPDFYAPFLERNDVRIVYGKTYELLSVASAALVTSGTATLETALFGVPQVVCYGMKMPRLMGFLRRKVLKVRHVSLVNLIAGREVVPELIADGFSVDGMRRELSLILPSGPSRRQMLDSYEDLANRLGKRIAPERAAEIIVERLGNHSAKA